MGILWDDPNFSPIEGERRKRKKSGEGVRKEEAGKWRRAWDGEKEKRFFVKKDKCTCIYKK